MAAIAVALLAGLMFGLGLAVSAMTDPVKILAFLDITGAWDPSLIFVMASAVALTALGVTIGRRRVAPLAAARFASPPASGVDRQLIAGALIFGAGWGVSGYCPGPAIAAAPFAGGATWIFVAAMGAGMLGAKQIKYIKSKRNQLPK